MSALGVGAAPALVVGRVRAQHVVVDQQMVEPQSLNRLRELPYSAGVCAYFSLGGR